MTLDYVVFISDALFWGLFIFVKAVQPKSPVFSAGELQRRANSGDGSAAHDVWRLGLLPRVNGLKWLIETLVLFTSITILFQTLKPLSAILLSLVLIFVSDFFSRRHKVQTLAARWYRKYEPGILRRIDSSRWLDAFKRSGEAKSLRIGSREELEELINHLSIDVITRDEKTMLMSQLEFANKRVKDVMTPRSMIDAVSVNETIGPLLLDRLHRSSHSRFPVYEDDMDHIVGTLYLHELIGTKGVPDTVKKAMHTDVYYIGENRDLEHALYAFLHSRHHLFIVVNEYRETVGTLSLEDVIETLIGRSIVDEFDAFDNLRTVAETNPKSNNTPRGKNDI